MPVTDVQREAGFRVLERFYRARFGGVAVTREEADRLGLALVALSRGQSKRPPAPSREAEDLAAVSATKQPPS